MKRLYSIFTALLVCLSTASIYGESWGYFALDNGYRWDRITQRAAIRGPTVSEKETTQTLKHINSYQLGGRIQWNVCEGLFLRGIGHYGWIFDGNYAEGNFRGRSKGHTYDIQGAMGYYLWLSPCVWFAPVAGWSYDALQLKGSHIKTVIEGVVYKDLNDIKAHQRFSGPFLGLDFVYRMGECVHFIFGYEFHYATWHGQRIIQGPEYREPIFGITTGFSNTRHIDRVYGQVFKLDSTFQFCECWFIGVGLKYQCFNGDFGKYKRTKTPLNSKYTHANVDGLWWHSFASTIYVGREF